MVGCLKPLIDRILKWERAFIIIQQLIYMVVVPRSPGSLAITMREFVETRPCESTRGPHLVMKR